MRARFGEASQRSVPSDRRSEPGQILPVRPFRSEDQTVRFAHYSEYLTEEAKFKDWRSEIGVRFDGSLRVTLKGKDMEALREAVFNRDIWKCVDRKQIDLNGMCVSTCEGPLELSHWPPRGRSGGSDTMEGTSCRCRKHHRLLDNNQVKWTQKVSV